MKKDIQKLLISGVITTNPYAILWRKKILSKSFQKHKQAWNHRTHRHLLKQCKHSAAVRGVENESVLEGFENNKIPGNDGIPIEFYNAFWPSSRESFINCGHESWKIWNVKLHETSRFSPIEKERIKIVPWLKIGAQISLLTVNAKKFSKVIATRIKNVLPSIINHNQTGYVKNRFIGETLRSMLHMMHYTAKQNIPGLMVFGDFH